MKKILVVADDLAAFRGENPFFDQLPEEWEVHYSASRNDALFCVRHSDFDIMFADLCEGPLASADLLYELRVRQPNAVRFVIGPGTDPEVLVACARGTHQFLQKPLDEALLMAALGRAECVHQLLGDRDIQKLVASIRIFPSRPKVYLEVMRELRDSMGSPQSIGALVAEDLGLSTKLLQVVNSAYFGLAQRVSCPSEAVLHLGIQTTASLVLALEVFAQFDHLNPNYFAIDHIWRHSQKVGDAARRLAEDLASEPGIARDAYTAGLVHDIGKLALSVNLKEEYGGVLRLARQRAVPVWQAEQSVFGTTHAAVGAYLLALWGMPSPVIQAVAGHHAPASRLPFEFTALTALHLANTLEYERAPLRSAFRNMRLDLDYPSELGLETLLAGSKLRGMSVTQDQKAGQSPS